MNQIIEGTMHFKNHNAYDEAAKNHHDVTAWQQPKTCLSCPVYWTIYAVSFIIDRKEWYYEQSATRQIQTRKCGKTTEFYGVGDYQVGLHHH